MSKIRCFFNQIDLYGLTFPLRYQKHNSYNTLCGITLSLLTILSISGIVLYFFIKNIKRTGLSIISNTENLYEKKLFNFTKYPFLVGYVNNYGRAVQIDPTYLTITLDKNEHYPEKNEKGVIDVRRVSIPIKLEYCKIDIHFNDSDIKEMIKEFEYQNYLCPVPGQNLSIGGRWGDSVHGYDMLEFHISKCENNSEKHDCKNNEEMNNFFKNSYMSIIYLAQSLDHYDIYNPIKKKFRSEIFFIVNQLVKRYYYYFLPGEYIYDNGYIFSHIKSFDFFEYDRYVIDFIEKEEQDYYSNSTLVEVAFSSIDKFITYERKYSKLQYSLGNIGGWIRIILVICQFISDYFSEKVFLIDIINSISNINFDDNVNNFSNSNEEKNLNKINNFIFGNNSNQRTKSSPYSINQLLKENKINNTAFSTLKLNENKNEKKYIKFSLLEYLIPIYIMEKKEKYSFFIYYKDFIYKDISLEVLIPLIERLLNLNFLKGKKNDYISKMNSTVFHTLNIKNKLNVKK